MKVATSVWSGEEKKSSTLVVILLAEREKKTKSPLAIAIYFVLVITFWFILF